MNGAIRPLILDIMDDDPTARWRTGVGNSSAVYTYMVEKQMVMAALPSIVNVVTNHARSTNIYIANVTL